MTQKLNSNALKLEAVRLVLEGISKHRDELANSGVTEEFVQQLSSQKLLVEQTEATQERLKADKISCTALLKKEMKILMKLYNRARRLIKVDVPNTGWLEYGIGVKR